MNELDATEIRLNELGHSPDEPGHFSQPIYLIWSDLMYDAAVLLRELFLVHPKKTLP